MSAQPNVEIGQTVHYHAPWKRPIETDVYHREIDAEDYAVVLQRTEGNDWVCGITDGTLCVTDICQNRESAETYVLSEGEKAVAIDPANQHILDHWAALYADCWGE